MGAAIGNQNARKGKWAEALNAAVQEVDPVTKRRKLHSIAAKLIELAQAGEIQAIKELGDRIDGKPAQAIVGPDGGAIQIAEVPWLKGRDLAGR